MWQTRRMHLLRLGLQHPFSFCRWFLGRLARIYQCECTNNNHTGGVAYLSFCYFLLSREGIVVGDGERSDSERKPKQMIIALVSPALKMLMMIVIKTNMGL